ncbi:hypothetical protein ABC195_13045 [Microbacterium sp. 2P01SA-2]|uniref:hypothetical protein n=1 Tax=unclassified Microbacterium TaxID=2609290 RepID=UPI0039A0C815
MNLRFLLSEVARNLLTGTARAGLLVLVSALLLTACIALDIVSVAQVNAKADAYRSAGGATRLLVAEDAVNKTACEALARVDGVSFAGAVRHNDPLKVDALPGSTLPHYSVTAGLAVYLGIPHSVEPGVYMPDELAARWGLDAGAVLSTDRGVIKVLGIYDYPESDGRDPRFANAVIDVTSFETASECWAESWPRRVPLDDLLRTVVDPDRVSGAETQLYALNPRVSTGGDAWSQFSERPSRVLPAAAIPLMCVVGAAATIRRRLEHSSNLHAGASRRALATVALLECLAWCSSAGVITLASASWMSSVMLPDDARPLIAHYTLVVCLGLLAAGVGAAAPFILISEAQLFRAFKARR